MLPSPHFYLRTPLNFLSGFALPGIDIKNILAPRNATLSINGMKCLLLDRETKTMVSLVTSMQDILSKQVFLVENLESPAPESVRHLKAIVICRPTRDNLARLEEHLRTPKFVEYHLFFTNFVDSVSGRRRGHRRGIAAHAPIRPTPSAPLPP